MDSDGFGRNMRRGESNFEESEIGYGNERGVERAEVRDRKRGVRTRFRVNSWCMYV